ncbi:MbtH family protein [Photorhabdus temperata]|uniref:MbtH-like domain-containing protein n=2 Tax=Photorhabdus temperata TaxID=574560 RepID=A0A081RZ75_PHOTE|nr:MbtH family NRPS accessory protein [Photorhabdus temperata]ERT11922.1 hypothetical protein O185_16950 [Photorhabdus temperata J3]KER03978.1 hypothetical protein MEG1DRAFT_01258 [Photorhabdus temperata subsp. temperata Meg1]MCT8347112.1 MbtH family protein [Photorhabdus temperata]
MTRMVVQNRQNIFSVWSISRTLPDGWYAMEVKGSKKECLEWIDAHWTTPFFLHSSEEGRE